MSYQIIIPKPVQKQLDSLPKTQRDKELIILLLSVSHRKDAY
jgi:mRNA-degrading endonuclease RelE of RelBE toxin-antitoxin system